jgi:hypothetical protein
MHTVAALVLGLSTALGVPAPVAVRPPYVAPAGSDLNPAGVPKSTKVIERRVIGRSVQGRDIVAYRKGRAGAARTVMVIGEMHGDERGGLVTAKHLIERVAVRTDVDVWVIQTINPDGYAARTRTNAHGVDLNRNFPENWVRSGRGTPKYSGPRPASEPETKALMAFLTAVQPDEVASIHQPLKGIGRSPKGADFQRRLSRQLGLPITEMSRCVRRCPGWDAAEPTMSYWYNRHFPGVMITVEYGKSPTSTWLRKAGVKILAAEGAG